MKRMCLSSGLSHSLGRNEMPLGKIHCLSLEATPWIGQNWYKWSPSGLTAGQIGWLSRAISGRLVLLPPLSPFSFISCLAASGKIHVSLITTSPITIFSPPPLFSATSNLSNKGASINDIRKIFGFFDPLPSCPHLELIYTTKFTHLSLLYCFSMTPLPLRWGHHIWTLPNHVVLGHTKTSDLRGGLFIRSGIDVH